MLVRLEKYLGKASAIVSNVVEILFVLHEMQGEAHQRKCMVDKFCISTKNNTICINNNDNDDDDDDDDDDNQYYYYY